MAEIRLELLTEAHLGALEPMTRDPQVLRFTRIPDPPPADFVHTWLAAYERGRADGTREAFAIVDGRGEVLGVALAARIDAAAQEAELGYIVGAEARGKGVGAEALRQRTAWAFEEQGLLRIELCISVDNEASKRVAERAGYTCEGVLRSAYVKPGLREDTELWSRLPGDA